VSAESGHPNIFQRALLKPQMNLSHLYNSKIRKELPERGIEKWRIILCRIWFLHVIFEIETYDGAEGEKEKDGPLHVIDDQQLI
jgi:hypothetical protein